MSCLFFAHQLSLFLIHVPPVYRLHENFDARAGYRVKVEDMYTDYMHNFCSLALFGSSRGRSLANLFDWHSPKSRSDGLAQQEARSLTMWV